MYFDPKRAQRLAPVEPGSSGTPNRAQRTGRKLIAANRLQDGKIKRRVPLEAPVNLLG
jgi:hypothetical protein